MRRQRTATEVQSLTRTFGTNLLRVVAGAGKPGDLRDPMTSCLVAFEKASLTLLASTKKASAVPSITATTEFAATPSIVHPGESSVISLHVSITSADPTYSVLGVSGFLGNDDRVGGHLVRILGGELIRPD